MDPRPTFSVESWSLSMSFIREIVKISISQWFSFLLEIYKFSHIAYAKDL